MLLTVAIEDYLATRAPFLSAKTLRWYEHKLRLFADWCGPLDTTEFRAPLIARYIRELQQTSSKQYRRERSSYTVHGYTQVLKQFAGWLDRQELTGAVRSVATGIEHPRVEIRVIQTFTPTMLQSLFVAADTQPNKRLAARDKAILLMLLDCGMRASELCGLRLEHVHMDIRDSYITVFGKRLKERELSLGVQARSALAAYLHRWRPEGRDLPFVFLGIKGDVLTPDGLDQMLYRMEERAGGEKVFGPVRVSAHTFRHTFAIRQLEAGTDIYRLSRLLGHGSIAVTQMYLRDYQARSARRSVQSVVDSLKIR